MKVGKNGHELRRVNPQWMRKEKLKNVLISTVLNECDPEFMDIYRRYTDDCKMLLQLSCENNNSLPELSLDVIVSHYKKRDNMSFKMAYLLTTLGCFMTHNSFDSEQSMHMWKNSLYYEDGANLTATGFTEDLPKFLEEGWYVKFYPDKVDTVMLENMHTKAQGMMLQGASYEECIKR